MDYGVQALGPAMVPLSGPSGPVAQPGDLRPPFPNLFISLQAGLIGTYIMLSMVSGLGLKTARYVGLLFGVAAQACFVEGLDGNVCLTLEVGSLWF